MRSSFYTGGMQALALRLYDAATVRELDRRAIDELGVSGYELMQRAARGAWKALQARWPRARRIVVVAGGGNNGGDGYELARLARGAGCDVTVIAVGAPPQRGEALQARAAWQAEGAVAVFGDDLPAADVVVDALYGTGLSRAPESPGAQAIAAINAARARGAGVLALDLPSGLDATTGATPGAVVDADLTVSFVGNKLGLYLQAGPDHAGERCFDALELPASLHEHAPIRARLMDREQLHTALPRRARSAYKNRHGHVLIVGGNHGMAGAALLAGRAALRSGAGLVTIATRSAHAALLVADQPELMCHGLESAEALMPLCERADVIAIGPGLGQDDWSRAMWTTVLAAQRPLILDADALNLLARHPRPLADAVLTPHPGEAARLLGTDNATVQGDRLAALAALESRFSATVVLKGVGTLVTAAPPVLCPYGNPGMAVAGMGDVLTGVVAGLRAQGLPPGMAASTGVLVHALAGDGAAVDGERGLLPSDLIDALREVVNP